MHQRDAAIESAIQSVRDLLTNVEPEERYDLRQDLRQELALKIVEKKIGEAGLRTAARNWLLNYFRDHRQRLKMEREYDSGMGRYRDRDVSTWKPTWYPPHKDAREYAPFACREARVMCVSSSSSTRTPQKIEDAYVDFCDSRRSGRVSCIEGN